MKPCTITVAGQRVQLVSPAPTGRHDPVQNPWQDALPAVQTPVDRRRAEPDGRDERLHQLAGGAAQALLEVLQRRRSPGQAAGWMDEDTLPLVLAWMRQRDWGTTRIVSVRPSRASSRALEASLHLADRTGHFAVAVRLEHSHGRWMLTLFEVMLPPAALGQVA